MPRTCSSCTSSIPIPDDAKFCPSCGARVDSAAESADSGPATVMMPAVVDPTATAIDAPRVFAGRFVVTGDGVDTPLGTVLPATDSQGGGAVRFTLVSDAAIPSAALADRALREWKQLAKVTTPKIIRVIDQGKLDDGKLYVASDMPKGQTLEEYVAKSGPLSLDRIKSIVTQVGEALTEAQKVGVIHRDVSPRNIHIDGDNVTVGEFGLAEAVTDKVFGTPAFLSPEQAEGKPVDQRSNIYSLGAVIYYMLTGVPPFEGTPASLLAQHVSGTPPHPSSKRPTVPGELDRIVTKALEKSGGRRHLTLRQLITEVEGVSPSAAVVRADDVSSAATLPPPEPAKVEAPKRSTASTMIGMSFTLPKPPTETPAVDDAKTIEVSQLPPKETPVFVDSAKEPKSAPRHSHDDVPVFVDQKAEPSEGPKTAIQAVVVDVPDEKPAIVEAPKPVDAPKVEAPKVEAPKVEAPKPVEAPKVEAPPVVEAPKAAVPVAQGTPAVSAEAPKAAAGAAAAGKKGGFRETAWFKKGELEEELAKQSSSEDPLAPTGQTGKHAAIDAADVSAQDERRLSLKTGATQMMPAIKMGTGASPVLPGERMDEEEMLAEMDSGRRLRMIAGVIAAIAIVVTILAYAISRAQPEAPKTSEAMKTAPTPPPSAPAVAPTPPAPTATVPTALPPPPQTVTTPKEAPAPTPVTPTPAPAPHAAGKHKKHK